MTVKIHKLAKTFAVLTPKMKVEPAAVTDTIYQELDERYDAFRGHVLVSGHTFEEDWPTWEQHPAGDEIVMLLSGRVRLILRMEAGDEAVSLSVPGSYVVIPRGTWHTARVREPATMLFITPGEGTLNEAEPT